MTNIGTRKILISFVIFSFVALLLTNESLAQKENIKLSEKVDIDKLYVGQYARTNLPTDSLITFNRVSFRTGILLSQQLSSLFSVSTQGALQVENRSPLISITDFEFITHVSDRFQIRVGSLTTPNTFIRPNPITWQSQTETYAQSRIIGGRPGVIASYSLSNDASVVYGLHNHNGIWASHVRIGYRNLKVGGYLQSNDEYFVVADVNANRIKGVVNYASKFNEIAGSLFYDLTSQYTFYADANFIMDTKSRNVSILGIRSYFRNVNLFTKGFLALEYDFATHLISAELFIHLN